MFIPLPAKDNVTMRGSHQEFARQSSSLLLIFLISSEYNLTALS